MNKLHNRKSLKEIRKSLRNYSTSAEATLWTILKNKQVFELKFRRQQSIGNYIVDFYCPEINLVIELDGEYHASYQDIIRDENRDNYMQNCGLKVLRFENKIVFQNPGKIISQIEEIKNNISPK